MPPYRERFDSDMYCPLCGTLFFVSDPEGEFPEWLGRAALLTTGYIASGEFKADLYRIAQKPNPFDRGTRMMEVVVPSAATDTEKSRLVALFATSKGSSVFEITSSKEDIVALYINHARDQQGHICGGVLYIPLHEACLKIVEKYVKHSGHVQEYIRQESPYGAKVEDIQSIWDLCLSRATIGCGHDIVGYEYYPAYRSDEPHDYFIPAEVPCSEWNLDDDGELCMSDPFDIEMLTEQILNNLTVVNMATGHQTDTVSKPFYIDNLPREIQDSIGQYLCGNLTDLSLQCTNLLPQSWWRENLSNGTTFPWLWDLDSNKFLDKGVSAPCGQQWDWELLTRKLSQTTIHELKNNDLQILYGLKNRRRIWRLLDVARVGDMKEKYWGPNSSAAPKGLW